MYSRDRARDHGVPVAPGWVMAVASVEADKQKLERRRQILDAAKAVFAEAGYHGASINAIIERAQIARGTFYLYFESKAAVFDSILDQAMADLRGADPPDRGRRPGRAAAAGPAPRASWSRRSSTSSAIARSRRSCSSAGHTPDAEAARAARPVLHRHPRPAGPRDRDRDRDRPDPASATTSWSPRRCSAGPRRDRAAGRLAGATTGR